MNKLTLKIMFCLLLVCQPVTADYDINEGRTLVSIIKELDYLIDLAKTQEKIKRSSPIVFNYGALASDLTEMRNLIVGHMERATQAPNTLEPVNEKVDPVSFTYSRKHQ